MSANGHGPDIGELCGATRAPALGRYIPGGDIGMWQGALRHPEDPTRQALAEAIDRHEPITIEPLYSDLAGRLDAEGPRPGDEQLAEAATMMRDELEAAQRAVDDSQARR